MAIAQVCWLSAADGGRKTPFRGRQYITVARFHEERDKWQTEAWSLVVTFREESSGVDCALADVKFLVDEAPIHLLHAGSHFELLEGPHLVANGEILSE